MQHKFTLRYKTFTDLGPALMSVEREKSARYPPVGRKVTQ